MAAAQRWYLVLSGKTHGPFPVEELARRLEEGEIDAAAMVCPEGGSKWAPLSAALPGLVKPAVATPAEEPTPREPAPAAREEAEAEPVLRGTVVHIKDQFGADLYELKVTHTMLTYTCERTTGCLWVVGLPMAVLLPPVALAYVFWQLAGGHREASLLLRNLDSLEVRKQPRWNYVIYGWLLLGLLGMAYYFFSGSRQFRGDSGLYATWIAFLLAVAVGVVFTILLICRRRIQLVGTSFNNVFVYESDRTYSEMKTIRDRIWKTKLEGL